MIALSNKGGDGCGRRRRVSGDGLRVRCWTLGDDNGNDIGFRSGSSGVGDGSLRRDDGGYG